MNSELEAGYLDEIGQLKDQIKVLESEVLDAKHKWCDIESQRNDALGVLSSLEGVNPEAVPDMLYALRGVAHAYNSEEGLGEMELGYIEAAVHVAISKAVAEEEK